MDDRDRRLDELAGTFRAYLTDQTGVELPPVDGLAAADLRVALERLDLALGQLADLATVYGDDTRGMLDPLAAPSAALVGAYLRVTTGATWEAPDPSTADELAILLPGLPRLDLLGLARTALAGGAPRFAALVKAGE